MKHIVNINHLPAILISAVMTLCGCSNENILQPDLTSVPLNVGSLRLNAGLAARAGGTLVTTDGATIGIFLTNEGGYTAVYNKTYTCTDGKWENAAPVCVDNRTGKVLAVYDPNGLVTFAANSTVTTNTLQAQSYDDKKIWYYDNTTGSGVNNTNSTVAFQMIPAYSRLKLSIKRHASNYVGNCAITDVKLQTTGNLYTNNALDISSAALQGSADTKAWSYNPNIASIAAGATNTDYDVIFPPQSLSSDLTITLTIDGMNRSVTVPAVNFGGSLKAGQQYTIELLITESATIIFNGNINIDNDYTADGTDIKNNTPTEI